MNLRKEKAALIKLAVLQETHKLIGKKSFEDLHVLEICERVKISKVTFFSYFPKKEDLLLYHLRLWCLTRAVELNQKPRVGIQGIYFLTDKIVGIFEQMAALDVDPLLGPNYRRGLGKSLAGCAGFLIGLRR